MAKSLDAFRTISEVAKDLDVPKHVLRFWEVKFPQVRPMKRGGGRRYYRPEDLVLLRGIRHLLHAEGYTIKGVQKILREQGVDHVKTHGADHEGQSPANGSPIAKLKAQGRVRSLALPAKTEVSGGLAPKQADALRAAIAELTALKSVLSAQPATGAATRSAKRQRAQR